MINKTSSIMVVDDNPTNLKLLTVILEETGYQIEVFTNASSALEAARQSPPDLALLDINMPEMGGIEMCQYMKADAVLREIPVLFISAISTTEDKVRAFEAGGVDYVTKPFQVEEVRARVRTHLTLGRLQAELQSHNRDLERRVIEKAGEIYDSQVATIFALSKLAEHRDTDTGLHLERVQHYTWLLAEELRCSGNGCRDLTKEFVTNLYHATPLHDIGKVSIRDNVLLKPGKLTAEEFELMKTHTTLGADTIQSVRTRYPNNVFLTMGLALTRYHHERWDGKGYPDGLAGEAIPLEGRIMAVADVYDALRSARVYKPAFSHEQTRTALLEGSGTQFDPAIVDAFAAIESEFERFSDTMND